MRSPPPGLLIPAKRPPWRSRATASRLSPLGWQAELLKWLKHENPYLSELILDYFPEPIPSEVLDYLPTALADNYVDLQIAACHIAEKNPREAYQRTTCQNSRNSNGRIPAKYAVDAARANGLKAKYDPAAPFVDQAKENAD